MTTREVLPAKRWILRALAALASILLLFVLLRRRPIDVDAAQVVRGSLREQILTDGILRTHDRRVIPAPADGDIQSVTLKVGDPIRKGQIITRIYWDMGWDPIRSPMNGVISQVIRETAGPIHRGEPIIEIVDPERLEVVLELLTSDAMQVRPGSRASVRIWPGQAPPLEAKVTRISRAGYKKYSALGVEEERTEVLLDPSGVPESIRRKLGSTYHVDVELILGEHSSVLKIPMAAVFRQSGKWQTFKIESGKARATEIEIIARSREEAAVSSGLREGEWVILSPGETVRDGNRVQSARH